MTIRAHLMLLAVGAVLPVLAFAILVSIVLVMQDRMTVERAATDRARAVMTAVDAELRGVITTLQAITASPALDAGDLAMFHAEAARILATQPNWLDITLSLPSGEKVLDALRPVGAPREQALDPGSLADAVRTQSVIVGNVDRLDASAPAGIPMRVPVMQRGRLAYVLSAVVRPDSFQGLLGQQRLPDGWTSGIVDAHGRFVARVPPLPAGELASVAFRAAVLRAPEGWYRGLTVEGRDTFTAHQRSDFSHWSIGLAVPASTVEAAAFRTAWLMGVGVASSVVVTLAIALLLGRRIASPIVELASVARSVGARRGAIAPLPQGVREVNDVAAALREADVAVREREQLIQREKDALQNADRAKDEFIAALSHELRNPLAALTAAAHILRAADPTNPAAADARGVIDRQTKHMSRMIEDLLDMSRLIAGKAHLLLETFDLGPLVAATVDAWRSAGRFGGQVVVVDAQSAWVRADRTRMEQILANLLDNAGKFTPAGKTIAVRVRRDGESAVLTVADEGEGIAPALLDRVFEVFVQGNQDVGRSKGGIGLGLTLVKRLTEMQGGHVSVASAGIGRGTAFTVWLPAAAPAAYAELPETAQRSSSGRTILIVEDNADARMMLHEVLAMQGHAVVEAPDGASGIARAAEAQPDIAIIDIGLPDIDGYEVARRMRAQAGDRIALIALTGYGQPEDQRRAMAAGFDIHLVKPVSVERLEQVIASLDALWSVRTGD
jgi:signal transduction histidine kinase/ActR/RegA family two-component response regulator